MINSVKEIGYFTYLIDYSVRITTQFLALFKLCVLIVSMSDGTNSLKSTEQLFMSISFTLKVFFQKTAEIKR